MSRDLLYFGRFLETSGYAVEARSYVLGLRSLGYRIRLLTLPERLESAGLIPEEERAALAAMQAEAVEPASAVAVLHQKPGTYPSVGSRARVARVAFETDRIPAGWAPELNGMTQVWVPSRFNLESFAAGGVRPERLRLVRQGIDAQRFHPGAPPRPMPGAGRFRFLSAFTWQDRKGWDILVRAFLSEFRADEGVELVIWAQPYYRAPAAMQADLDSLIRVDLDLDPRRTAPIHLITERCSDCEMPGLYTACDAFVLPTRGEGWGRPLAEAMACGKPVVATGWGGNLDFMTPANSYLIDIERLTPVRTGVDVPDFLGHQWAEPSVDHLRQLMRRVTDRPAEAAERGRRAQAEMVASWDIRRVVAEFAAALEDL